VLVKGITAAICSDCLAMVEVELSEAEEINHSAVIADITPAAIVKHLDQYVIGQDDAKRILAVAAFNHLKRCMGKLRHRVEKSNIWLIGPSGTGKTLLANALSEFLGLPFASIDTTTITEAGYVGEDPEIIVSKLLHDSEGDTKLAETGIVFLDEVDKLARSGSNGGHRDIKGLGVQQSLLRMVEGDLISANPEGKKRSSSGPAEQVDTRNILFILGGAFVGLKEQMGKSQIGMNRDLRTAISRPVNPEDLIKFGMIPELCGRVPMIAELKPLTRDDLIRIMTEPKDAICKQYQALLAADGVTLTFSPEFLSGVADLAIKEGTGARGLRAIMERVLLPVMFDAPSMARIEKDRVREMREVLMTAEHLR
jgi:ATP-dependent Clp protease ATP-binding subunit ClpX